MDSEGETLTHDVARSLMKALRDPGVQDMIVPPTTQPQRRSTLGSTESPVAAYCTTYINLVALRVYVVL
jgi:hypothetical protein